MNELILWFEDRYDPDEIVDLLDISTSELIRKFHERAQEFKLADQDGGEEEDTLEERL